MERGKSQHGMTQMESDSIIAIVVLKKLGFYRPPTEAEWGICLPKAGSNTYTFWADTQKALSDYAWTDRKANESTQKVRHQKPSPWDYNDIYGKCY